MSVLQDNRSALLALIQQFVEIHDTDNIRNSFLKITFRSTIYTIRFAGFIFRGLLLSLMQNNDEQILIRRCSGDRKN